MPVGLLTHLGGLLITQYVQSTGRTPIKTLWKFLFSEKWSQIDIKFTLLTKGSEFLQLKPKKLKGLSLVGAPGISTAAVSRTAMCCTRGRWLAIRCFTRYKYKLSKHCKHCCTRGRWPTININWAKNANWWATPFQSTTAVPQVGNSMANCWEGNFQVIFGHSVLVDQQHRQEM